MTIIEASTAEEHAFAVEYFSEHLVTMLNHGVSNLRFEARDLRDFSEPGRYDLIISFDAVHHQPDPQAQNREGLKP